jgi:hypothetical protein
MGGPHRLSTSDFVLGLTCREGRSSIGRRGQDDRVRGLISHSLPASLTFRPLAGLAQVQEPGRVGGQGEAEEDGARTDGDASDLETPARSRDRPANGAMTTMTCWRTVWLSAASSIWTLPPRSVAHGCGRAATTVTIAARLSATSRRARLRRSPRAGGENRHPCCSAPDYPRLGSQCDNCGVHHVEPIGERRRG